MTFFVANDSSIEKTVATEPFMDMVSLLFERGVIPIPNVRAQGPFSNKTFLITGTLSHYKRHEAEQKIKDLGGRIVSSVSKNLHYLVVGESPGSKLEKARKMGSVNVLSESEFDDIIQAS